MPPRSYSNQCEFRVFSCIEQPVWQSILTFSPKCQKLFIIWEKTTSLSKSLLISMLWKPLTILGKITVRQSLDGSIHLFCLRFKKEKKFAFDLGSHSTLHWQKCSFCLKAWGLQMGLPSPGWGKTISFSLIAAELKGRVIYLNFWSMKPKAASVRCLRRPKRDKSLRSVRSAPFPVSHGKHREAHSFCLRIEETRFLQSCIPAS